MTVRFVTLFLLLTLANAVHAVSDLTPSAGTEQALLPSEWMDDRPLQARTVGQRADTTWYGSYHVIGGVYYAQTGAAKQDVMWNFDRGNGPFNPPLGVIPGGEGWSVLDLSGGEGKPFRVIDATLDLGEGVPPPILSGERSLWIGADKPESDSLCWDCGAGYGNRWCRRVTSEPLAYDGSGDVALSFLYWSFSEPCYDATQLYLLREDGTELLLNPFPQGECWNNAQFEGGTFTDSIGHWSTPATFERTVTSEEIGTAQEVRFVFEFTSDGGWSDEDCEFPTIWGPFGADEIVIAGSGIDVSYDFETGLQGWEPGACNAVGSFAGVADVGDYTILDPCDCRLAGNVLEVHDGEGDLGNHPDGQYTRLISPICDILTNQGPGDHTIFMEYDLYAVLPSDDGVLFRSRWLYYPFECPTHQVVRWSDPVGQEAWYFYGWDPACFTNRVGGTDIANGTPVPPDAEMVRMVLEIRSDCEAFAIDPCSGNSNATPLLDNLAVGVTERAGGAPLVSFNSGAMFQDTGSYPSDLFDRRATGPANVTRDLNLDTPPGTAPDLCGDSLTITGPIPSSDPNTRWEAKLWWRVAKRAPFQADQEGGVDTRYKIWKDRVADGRAIDRPDRPEFTWGWMDSVQVGYVTYRNGFLSDFREDDDDFVGEGNEENEMLWDDVFRPGTRIEYFVTANYVLTPGEVKLLPDTSGGYFYEFEVLPGLRTARLPDCGGTGFDYCVYQSATLYIDAYGRGAQFFIENALGTVLNGLDPCGDENGCPIPQDRNWDRYDYGDVTSNWNAPFARGSVPGSNNGMTMEQLLGYRAILVNTGTLGGGAMQDEDFALFDRWLHSPDCNANANRQVFVMNGDRTGELLEEPGGQEPEGHGPAFLNNVFGATLRCDAFHGHSNDPDCGEENDSFCLRWLPVGGGPFGTDLDVDAYGSSCPNLNGYNIFDAIGGIGNRYDSAEDGLKEMEFSQIVNEDLSGGANYRVVLDAVSWNHMTERVGPGGDGSDQWCPRDTPSIVRAATSEIGAAMKWGFGVEEYESIPKLVREEPLSACEGTGSLPAGLDDPAASFINRLYQNNPNPFNPMTTIRFSLAQPGRVEIMIYDIGGRTVRRLVDENTEAGLHHVVWDGKTDENRQVGSGIYWCRLESGSYRSNMKMMILK